MYSVSLCIQYIQFKLIRYDYWGWGLALRLLSQVIKRWFPNAVRVQSEWIHRRHPCIVKQDLYIYIYTHIYLYTHIAHILKHIIIIIIIVIITILLLLLIIIAIILFLVWPRTEPPVL